jgi:hypothetical protein
LNKTRSFARTVRSGKNMSRQKKGNSFFRPTVLIELEPCPMVNAFEEFSAAIENLNEKLACHPN